MHDFSSMEQIYKYFLDLAMNFAPLLLTDMIQKVMDVFFWQRESHGHHEQESYYGDRDTETLVKMMEELATSIRQENQKLALEDKSSVTKRPAPLTGGCRIEGYMRAKMVPGNLIISSGAHSFDASRMNMSHVIRHLSFSKTVSPQVLSDVKRLIPFLGRNHDKLNDQSFINHQDVDANVTIKYHETKQREIDHQIREHHLHQANRVWDNFNLIFFSWTGYNFWWGWSATQTSVNGDTWAPAVEQAIGKLLNGFIVTNSQDTRSLRKCAKKARYNYFLTVINRVELRGKFLSKITTGGGLLHLIEEYRTCWRFSP
ncbi:Protein disulfide-isomerase 5-3 [Hibiscus syriacus]|uniref:Protein disulfide-isomerase 5-3 n=1 Tax=Hibiscus syriacus TaxID=106335 RepID=A0A6A2Y062_HIBSY|nr:Protein disulfide-isomerase 5-3 [Hibiscus syriacus]